MLHNYLRSLTLVLLGLLFVGTASAQRFGAGLIVGFNASQIDGDRYAGYNKFGLLGGIRGTVMLSDKLDLGMELRYSQIGSRSTPNQQNTINPFSITLNYAEVPITINYKDWYVETEDFYKLEFHAGLTYARLINSSLDDDPGSPFENIIDLFDNNYLGANIGVTYFFNEHLGATFRFNRALLFLYKNTTTNPNQNSLYSKHLSFSGIYKF